MLAMPLQFSVLSVLPLLSLSLSLFLSFPPFSILRCVPGCLRDTPAEKEREGKGKEPVDSPPQRHRERERGEESDGSISFFSFNFHRLQKKPLPKPFSRHHHHRQRRPAVAAAAPSSSSSSSSSSSAEDHVVDEPHGPEERSHGHQRPPLSVFLPSRDRGLVGHR